MADRRNTRLPGHALQAEGKPYERSDEEPWARVSYGAHPGSHVGVALCECGAASGVLTSDGQRKCWHRDIHKPGVRACMDEDGGLDPPSGLTAGQTQPEMIRILEGIATGLRARYGTPHEPKKPA